MRLKCVGLAKVVTSGVFFWEETDKENKLSKVFKRLGKEDEFDVDDQSGHEIMAKYKGIFQVVHYGEGAVAKPVEEKATTAPRTRMARSEVKK